MDRSSNNNESINTATEAPLADALIRLSMLTRYSFHTLPILHGSSIANSDLQEKYGTLYGTHLPRIELAATGTHFDSFFFPDGVIKKAESLAARLFGADGTLFVTTGTTTTNQIAIHALFENGFRVLLDRSCHISMHFALQAMHATVDHIGSTKQSYNSIHRYWCPEALLNRLLEAQKQNNAFQLVVLNGQTYDGLLYNIPDILNYLLSNGVKTRRFIIDEAWSSANYFDESTKHYTAMKVARLLEQHPDLLVVSTQSTHKTLSCLRQGSMLHFLGEKGWRKRLNISRFRIHTTSPSYPILASLDLARAQMETHGHDLVNQAMHYAVSFREAITSDPKLSMFSISVASLPKTPFPYACYNPMKVTLNISRLDMSPEAFRDRLLSLHGIYINCLTTDSVLINFHIGITGLALERLLDGLREIGQQKKDSSKEVVALRGKISDRFLIPYPPGVPILFPGDSFDRQTLEMIKDIQLSGVSILSV